MAPSTSTSESLNLWMCSLTMVKGLCKCDEVKHLALGHPY